MFLSCAGPQNASMSDGSSIEGIFCEAPSDNEGKEPYSKNKSDR